MNIKAAALLICWLLPASPAAAAGYSLRFAGEDIATVLQTLAAVSNTNMVIDDSIKGTISINLNNVSFSEALQQIAAGKGLTYRQCGSAYIIEPAGQTSVTVFQARHTRVADLHKTLDTAAGALKVKLDHDEAANMLLLSGPAEASARLSSLAASLDLPPGQVSISASVLSVSKSAVKNLGLEWTLSPAPQYAEIKAGSPPTAIHRENKGIIQFGRTPDGYPYELFYQAKINTLLSRGQARLLASPSLTALSGREAKILIGDRIPVMTEKTTGTTTSTTVEYIDAGIKLSCTPSITGSGTIIAKIRAEVSTPALVADLKNYRITTREAESTLCLQDGAATVIAGLTGNEENASLNAFPGLSRLPLIGGLFTSRNNSSSATEIIIILTAKIIKPTFSR